MTTRNPHTAESAFKELKAGNARFASGHPVHPNRSEMYRKQQAEEGQTPLAAVLACSDSRVPVEILFDQGVGDLFVILAAGQVAGPDQVGSIEYAVEHLGVPLVIVLGHTGCGAIAAALGGYDKPGDLGTLLSRLKPVAEAVKDEADDMRTVRATREAVLSTMEELRKRSPFLEEAAASGRITVKGGIYKIESGEIKYLEV